jgi:hypothetical protein
MMLPASEERPIVVFKVWPSLEYNKRLLVSFALIAVGVILQAVTLSLGSGLLLIIIGNLLLLVSGYDNRVDFKAYDPQAEWERVEKKRLNELLRMDKKIRKWDHSILDITNGLGAAAFILMAAGLGFTALFSRGMPRILAVDAMVLLLPHWLTGVRRILTQPNLVTKVKTIRHVLRSAEERLGKNRVDLLMLLKGTDAKIPDDVKFKVDIDGHHPDFLGLYGQVVLNEVQGSSYPYFYVVLVARQDFGLADAQLKHQCSRGIISELKNQGQVEVLVIRQKTTKTSGYHTKSKISAQIFLEGLELAEKVAGGIKKSA